MTMRWRAEGEMKWVWQEDWGPACRPHTSNFLVISFPCNFSIFIYWSHHISARFSSTKSNLKQMLMLENDCRTTHIQPLSFVICSFLNFSILHWIVKVEIFLSQWKLKSFYRYEKDWPMQIPRWPPLLTTMPGKMWSAYEWSLKVTEAQTQHNTLTPAAWIYLCFQNRYLFPHWYVGAFENLQKNAI